MGPRPPRGRCCAKNGSTCCRIVCVRADPSGDVAQTLGQLSRAGIEPVHQLAARGLAGRRGPAPGLESQQRALGREARA
jgi:hypothetical protein